MKKLIYTLSFFLFSFFLCNYAFAKEDSLEYFFKTQQSSTTIHIDEFLYAKDSPKNWTQLKLNEKGNVIYKGKILINEKNEAINDKNSGNSSLWLKIYLVAKGVKPRKYCDENDYFKNGIYGLGCYIDHPDYKISDSIRYKQDIEKTIKEEIINAKKEIKKLYTEIEKVDNELEKYTLIDYGISSILFNFYMKLINTTDKYIKIKQYVPTTSWYGELENLITPYLEANEIETKEMNDFLEYTRIQQKKLERKFLK